MKRKHKVKYKRKKETLLKTFLSLLSEKHWKILFTIFSSTISGTIGALVGVATQEPVKEQKNEN